MTDNTPKPKNKRYEKEKPWDNPNDGIDRWKFVQIGKGEMKGPLASESSFATLFPKYREKYIKEVWSLVKKALNAQGIKAELDLIEGSMTVRTTRKTWDPYIIVKARDVIKLLARSVPYEPALSVLEEETYCDIIKIRGIVGNKEKFVKRRQRLIGPNGNTLKALEMLTNCFVMVQGSTVAAVGHYKQMKAVRRVVIDCMKNVHPIYHIKEMMIKRELMKDDKLKNESWDRFLPNFNKRINNLKKKKVQIKQRERATFPPEQSRRLIDEQIETGEYFLTKQEKARKSKDKKDKKKSEKLKERVKERNAAYAKPDFDEEMKDQEATLGKRKDRVETVGLDDMKAKFGLKNAMMKF